MSNPTTPFGWQMPTATDLVTDLPADFEVFGQAVATSMADLLGGTTGQVLSKTTNADMDFTWVSANPGDITSVGVTAPITGGGTSGDVTIGIQDGTTAQKGAVQLENSTSSTSTTTAAVPASVKSAYDLANGAIPKTLTTTTGDTIYASAANTPARLGIGSTGQVLTVAGGVPTWAAPAGGGKVKQVVFASTNTTVVIASVTQTNSGLTATITPTANTSKILVIFNQSLAVMRGSNVEQKSLTNLYRGATNIFGEVQTNIQAATGSGTTILNGAVASGTYLDSPATTSATTYKTMCSVGSTTSGGEVDCQYNNSYSSITLIEIGA